MRVPKVVLVAVLVLIVGVGGFLTGRLTSPEQGPCTRAAEGWYEAALAWADYDDALRSGLDERITFAFRRLERIVAVAGERTDGCEIVQRRLG